MIGQTVTHYRILDKIGEGGMGVVYRAEDTRLGRQVAVKFLSADLSADPLALERFQREARAASSLSHPHICALYDVGQHKNVPFLVMELLEGQTLRRRLDGQPLGLDHVLDLGAQMADALDAAHALGMVHRDIKSGNVFLTTRGQIKILDFGLAKRSAGQLLDPAFDTTLFTPAGQHTDTGRTLGTLSYMSPEQARGEELDHRSDLFSFGVVLYEMATGRDPFAGKTPALILDAVLHTRPVPPSAINRRVPHELDQVILKALEKDRELRYQSAAEMRADLKRLRRESDATHTVVSAAAPVQPASVPARRIGRRHVWSAAAAVLVLLAAALAGYLLWRPAATTIDSVAVLPFASSDAGADTEYLTDGIAETLINGLAQLPELRVSARSLAFRYKGPTVDLQRAGRDLNVTAVVTGRVAARGDRLVIQADLMRVADGSQLWGGQYNRPMTDLLAVQEEIAAEILAKLRPKLSGADKQRAMRRYTDNAEAYRLYLQGRYHWNTGTIEGYQNAIGYFQSAIRQDANYALAYAGLADSYLLLGAYWVEAITEAKSAAERAIALDPDLAEARVALGHIKLWLDWDWAGAEAEFRRGISLDARSALAHNQYAMYLGVLGRIPEALAEARSAQQLEPLSPIVNADLGLHLLYANRRAEAIEQFRKTLELDSNSVSAQQGLGIAYSLDGRHDLAIAALRRALELSKTSPVVMGQLGAAYARQGNRAAAAEVLADLKTLSERAYVPATSFALVHAALGDRAEALDWLERAYDEHDFSMPRIGIAPWYESLRSEARLQALLTRLGLPR
jgi:serine/threonine-protein kinase